MNRRRFIQSLAAMFTLPAVPSLSLGTAAAVPSVAVAVPAQARFWSIYMTALHGECTPQTLQNLLHIPELDAKKYVGQLIADGVIKPNPLLQNSVSELVKPNDDSVVDKVKKRFEKKTEANSAKAEIAETTQSFEDLETERTEDLQEDHLEITDDEEVSEIAETETSDELDAPLLENEEHEEETHSPSAHA